MSKVHVSQVNALVRVGEASGGCDDIGDNIGCTGRHEESNRLKFMRDVEVVENAQENWKKKKRTFLHASLVYTT